MSNLTNNRLNVAMTAAQVTAVKNALQTIATNMPFLLGLTIEERIALPKINISNKVFTEDAINAVANNIGILPSYISATSMQLDYQLFTQLDELLGLMRQMVERMEDTQMLAGSEAYVAALSSYKLFSAAAGAGLSGADTITESLRVRFIQASNPDTSSDS